MLIREATPSDAELLYNFRCAIVDEGLPTLFQRQESLLLERVRLNLERICLLENSVVFLAYVDAEVVGSLDFHGAKHPQQRHCGSFAISVSRGHRGRGIGTSMIERLSCWAGKNGITRIELEVFSNNPRALRLYEHLGFKQEGIRKGAASVEGQLVDIILMAHRNDDEANE